MQHTRGIPQCETADLLPRGRNPTPAATIPLMAQSDAKRRGYRLSGIDSEAQIVSPCGQENEKAPRRLQPTGTVTGLLGATR